MQIVFMMAMFAILFCNLAFATAVPYSLANFNKDLKVDFKDYTILAKQWNKTSGLSADIAPSGGDGIVDVLDLARFASEWLVEIEPSSHFTTESHNTIETNGLGQANPYYGNLIKNLLIFQATGWKGLPTEANEGTLDPTWPLHWGKSGYLVKNDDVYQQQFSEIAALGGHVAVAMLIIPDEESDASGFKAYLDGTWVRPRACLGKIKTAALNNGLMLCPFFSINCYGAQGHGELVKSKLQRLLAWWKSNDGSMFLKNPYGKYIICTEGLPENTCFTTEQRYALEDWMNSQDVVWIDNLTFDGPARAAPNIYRSAATADPDGDVQDAEKRVWGTKYRWHFVHRIARFKNNITWMSTSTCNKWLNISPSMGCPWPIMISQWNEYAEFLTFEPSEMDGYNEYNYLGGKMASQP